MEGGVTDQVFSFIDLGSWLLEFVGKNQVVAQAGIVIYPIVSPVLSNRRRKIQRMKVLSLFLLVTAIVIIVAARAFALSVDLYANSDLDISESQITADSEAIASHLRVWIAEVLNPHSHTGSGQAYAQVGSQSDSDTGSFHWVINTSTFPDPCRMIVDASVNGPNYSSAFTYCWAASGSDSAYDSASN